MFSGATSGPCRGMSLLVLGALSAVLAMSPQPAHAAPKLRFQIDVKGDILLVGNTLGQECRTMDSKGTAIPRPVVGNLGACGDPLTINDSAPDVLWQSDASGANTAQADTNIMIDQGSSTSMVQLPTGARVVYARLYWGGNLAEDVTLASSQISFSRPGTGGFSKMLTPDAQKGEVATALGGGGGHVYQSTADVTAIVQQYGAGAYRVGNVVRRHVINRDEDVQYNAWSMVLIYRLDSEPVRNITVFDGLDGVDTGQSVNLSISGFNAPVGQTPQAKLAVIAYEGDSDKSDGLVINGKMFSDALNPANNVFNSTRSNLGAAVSVGGDLPQLTGTAGSMSGVDLDVLDISSMLNAGDTSASIQATSVDEVFFVGGLVTAIRSKKPVLDTTLIADPGAVRPGDTVTFTSTTKNVGDDDATGVTIRHPIPDGLTYVPGSIKFISGPDAAQNGNKSDQPGDDQAELGTDPLTGKPVLIIRIGKGANGTSGGLLSPTDTPVVVQYKLKTAPNAMGSIPTQSTTSGAPGSNAGVPPTAFPSGNGMDPNAPTVVNVPNANADLRILVTKTPPVTTPNTPTTYSVDVKNVGNTSDPGPIKVKFQVPPGGIIDSIKPGQGWTCSQVDRTVLCTRPTPMPAGETSRAVDVVVRQPTEPTMTNQVTASVGSDGAIDPNPADNVWDELTGLGGSTRIAGGGFSCSLDPRSGTAPGLWAALMTALFLVGVALRRARRQTGAMDARSN